MIHNYLFLSIILFCLGIVGVISRRNVFTVFMSIELMLNAANLAFIAFSRVHESMDGHVLAMMVMAVAAAEGSADDQPRCKAGGLRAHHAPFIARRTY